MVILGIHFGNVESNGYIFDTPSVTKQSHDSASMPTLRQILENDHNKYKRRKTTRRHYVQEQLDEWWKQDWRSFEKNIKAMKIQRWYRGQLHRKRPFWRNNMKLQTTRGYPNVIKYLHNVKYF
jgi:hypothetical protein